MARLIELDVGETFPPELLVEVGDILVFAASGGWVHDGGECVGILGVYVRSILGLGGVVVAPAGAPNAVLFRAHHPGRAVIAVAHGEAWNAPSSSECVV